MPPPGRTFRWSGGSAGPPQGWAAWPCRIQGSRTPGSAVQAGTPGAGLHEAGRLRAGEGSFAPGAAALNLQTGVFRPCRRI